MPRIRKQGPQGYYWERCPYRPDDYAVPDAALGEIERWRGGYQDVDAMLEERDGAFVGYKEILRYERDGKKWIVLQRSHYEYAVEIELTKFGFGDVRPVPPKLAYQIAIADDARLGDLPDHDRLVLGDRERS